MLATRRRRRRPVSLIRQLTGSTLLRAGPDGVITGCTAPERSHCRWTRLTDQRDAPLSLVWLLPTIEIIQLVWHLSPLPRQLRQARTIMPNWLLRSTTPGDGSSCG